MAEVMEPLIAELEQELPATWRVLEAVPPDQLNFRPHPKAMSLGQLAYHIAGLPAMITAMIAVDRFDITSVDFTPGQPDNYEQITKTFATSIAEATDRLRAMTDKQAGGIWKAVRGKEELMSVPRKAVVRMILLNHLYHHRGQLCTYLRIVGEKVPSVYGPTSDDNPFAG